MRRLIFAAVFGLALGLAGCGNTSTTRETQTKSTPDGEHSKEKETTVKTNSDGSKTTVEEKKTETKTDNTK